MTVLLGIILTLVVFSIIVFFHELGHFMTARWTGMKVEEFGMGIPPRAKIITTDKRGTLWTLNWLPIGGFVRIKGEDFLAPDGRDQDSFSSKKWWARSVVLLAGVTMNFVLAYFIFVGVFWTGATPIAPNTIINTKADSFFLPSFESSLASGYLTQSGGLIISSVTGSLAAQAGIGQDFKLRELNGSKITNYNQFVQEVKKGGPVTLTVEDVSGNTKTVTVTPEKGKIGVYVGYEGLEIHRDWFKAFSFVDSLKMGGKELYAMTIFTWDAMSDMMKKLLFPIIPAEREQAKQMVSGPIGIGKVFVSVIEYSIPLSMIWIIIALISFNLGFFNLLPLPALDGGRWLTTSIRSLVEFILPHNSHIGHTIEQHIHSIGFLLLVGLSIIIAYMDIARMF